MEYRLEHSLHNHIYIPLDKQKAEDEVDSPWAVYLKSGLKNPRELLKDTTIDKIFDGTKGQRLLILGAPGSGKTTTLLKLAKILIERAEQDSEKGIPVLLNLSSWKNDQQSIHDWIINNLKFKYGIRPDIGKRWLEEKTILPLLDGLDELKAARQNLCIQKVNEFLLNFWQVGEVVVCSRTEEYELQQSRFVLSGSIILQSLTEQKIESFLIKTENQQLWASIQQDQKLLELAKKTLFLDLMVIACQEISFEEWGKISNTEAKISYLLDAYIQRMLRRKIEHYQNINTKLKKCYPKEKMLHWLGWLAWQLTQHKETEIFIEYLQPSYLSLKHKVFFALIYAIIQWLCFVTSIIYLILLFLGSIVWILDLDKNGLATLLSTVLDGVEYVRLTFHQEVEKVIGYSFFANFIIILFFAINNYFFKSKISLLESLDLSFKKMIFIALKSAVNSGILFGIIGFFAANLIPYFFLGMILGMLDGIDKTIRETKDICLKIKPNEGVTRTCKNILFVTTTIPVVLGSGCYLLLTLLKSDFEILQKGHSIFVTLLVFLILLLLTLISHTRALLMYSSLRLCLFLCDLAAWNYANFLNDCTDRLVLQRVGGGYRFIHRYLQEHLAAQYEASLNSK